MPATRDLSSVLTAAEAAAAAGDYPSAAEQLRQAAAIQEAELGPNHPDLADTLNNLGVACEKAQRPDDAERHYRRALAIAIKAFPAGHEAIATSRNNLKEFCEAHGRPLEPPAPKRTPAPTPPPTPAPVSAAPRPSSRLAPAAPPHTPRFPVRPVAIAAALVGGLLLVVVVASRPWADSTSSPDASVTPAPTPPSAPSAATPASPAPTTGRSAPKAPPRPTSTPELPVVVNAGLCRNLTTGEVNWSCDRAASPVTAGPLVFYTRVRSPRDTTVQHRWYRGRELVQSVDLRIGANLGPGYRTYSRFPVTPGDDWRAELRASDGTVLHEERFVVR